MEGKQERGAGCRLYEEGEEEKDGGISQDRRLGEEIFVEYKLTNE